MYSKLDIRFTDAGRKQLDKVAHGNQGIATRIDRKVEELRTNPELLTRGLKPLSGTRRPTQYRLRIGKLRLVGYVTSDGTFNIAGIVYRKDLVPSGEQLPC